MLLLSKMALAVQIAGTLNFWVPELNAGGSQGIPFTLTQTRDISVSKSEVVQQLAKERRARQNAEKRERYWREKFNSQCLEMAEEDHDDLSQIFLNTGDQNVPTEMACLWEQQKHLLQCKSKNSYWSHPK